MHPTDAIRRLKAGYWRDPRRQILVAVAAGWFISIGARLTYPVLLPYLRPAYGLTLTTSGLLLTVLWLAYALGQLPGGMLADRVGERTVMAASMVFSALGLTAVVVGGNPLVLFAATIFFGFGTSLFGVVRLSAIADVYPEHVGTAFGLTTAAGAVGNAVLPPIAGILAAAVVWQLGFGFAIPLFLFVGLYLWVVVPNRTAPEDVEIRDDPETSLRDAIAMLRDPTIARVLAIQITGFSTWQAFTGFFPVYLLDVKSVSATAASGLFALFFGVGTFVKPLAGNGYDRFGVRRTLALLATCYGSALVLLVFVDGLWALAGVTVLLSPMLGQGTIALSYLVDELPEDSRNTVLGSFRTVYMVVGSLSPTAFGVMADNGFFDEAFLLLTALAVVTLGFVSRVPAGSEVERT